MHNDRGTIAPTLELEHSLVAQGLVRVAGVDEVGRGSWAGPLVAAAVILPLADRGLTRRLAAIRDSKSLTAPERDRQFAQIREVASAVSIGWVTHHVVDRCGLSVANRLALARAVQGLSIRPDALLLDHFRLPDCSLPQLAVNKADALSLSVAAASIVAKVVRDRWMTWCERRFPGYGFGAHKGYGTAQHRSALGQLGPCPVHRRSFAPVAVHLL